jgi:SAM-dependent methyltransferase
MLALAARRGIRAIRGVGEALPIRSASIDLVLVVFVIEFVDDLDGFLGEAARVLRGRGRLVVGFMDKDSAWGRYFRRNSAVRHHFHPPSPERLIAALGRAGLTFEASWQALFGPPPDLGRVERPRRGFGQGSFIVVKAVKGRGTAAGLAAAVVKRGRKT